MYDPTRPMPALAGQIPMNQSGNWQDMYRSQMGAIRPTTPMGPAPVMGPMSSRGAPAVPNAGVDAILRARMNNQKPLYNDRQAIMDRFKPMRMGGEQVGSSYGDMRKPMQIGQPPGVMPSMPYSPSR